MSSDFAVGSFASSGVRSAARESFPISPSAGTSALAKRALLIKSRREISCCMADWPNWYAEYIVREQAGKPLPS